LTTTTVTAASISGHELLGGFDDVLVGHSCLAESFQHVRKILSETAAEERTT